MPALSRLVGISLALLALACGGAAGEPGPAASGPVATATDPLAAAALGPGRVVWESNRSGAWRIWSRSLEGGPAARISPDEPGRDHCCAHLSPDGERMLYLSIPPEGREYSPPTTAGELRLVALADDRERLVAPRARHYGGHRAAIWWSATSFVYLHPDGSTRLVDLARGSEEAIADGPEDDQGWLVDPTGRWATGNSPTFSELDRATGRVRRATTLGGCEPIFTADGELGVWVAGAGGPIDVVDLATRDTRTIVRKNDARLPDDRGYMYFPALSRDRSLLAVGASNGEHDHFRADYDVLLIELDPDSLEPVGDAIRVTDDPAVDRYPDVWRLAAPRAARPQASGPDRADEGSSAVPPVFLWDDAEALNRRSADAESEILFEEGAAYADRLGRMALAGGVFRTEEATGERVGRALPDRNAFTLSMLIEPRALDGSTDGALVALDRPHRDRGLVLFQRGDRLELRLRTGKDRGGVAVDLLRFEGTGPVHLAVRFSPGRLAVFRDGESIRREAVGGDFYHWRADDLRFGAEPGAAERFRGWLSAVRIWDRELDDEAIAVAAEAALATIRDAPAMERRRIRGRLAERSEIPSLAEISPYRRALVVESWEGVETLDGGATLPSTVRVARWALLDGERTRGVERAPGAAAELLVEPFDAQRQLDAAVLSDTLAPAPEVPLFFDVGLADG